MKPEQITEALEQAAAQVGVKVRYETMTGDSSGAGGLCKIRGEWTVIMDRKSPPSDRAAMLLEALSRLSSMSMRCSCLRIGPVLAKRRSLERVERGECECQYGGVYGRRRALIGGARAWAGRGPGRG